MKKASKKNTLYEIDARNHKFNLRRCALPFWKQATYSKSMWKFWKDKPITPIKKIYAESVNSVF